MSCAYGKEFIVTWLIENYSFCSQENGDVIESPFFQIDCFGGSKWKLHLVPRDVPYDTEVTQCYLRRYDTNGEIWIDYKIEMIDPNGTILDTVEGKNEKFHTSFDSDYTLEIERAKLDELPWSENPLMLRCHMRSEVERPHPPIGCEIRTKIGIESHHSIWEVTLPLVDTARKEFSILENTKLKVELSKSGLICPSSVVIKISKIESDSPLQRQVSCKIILIDADGAVVKCKSGAYFFKSNTNDDVWEFSSFLTSLDLEKYSHERKKVTLQFEFCVTNGMQSETPSNFQYSTNADSLLTLQNDMRELYLSQKHTDVVLKLDESTTLGAHKSVLIARSPYFLKMFDNADMTESISGIVNVTEDKNVTQALLEYLYTGFVERMDCDLAKELMIASDKYLVPSLKDKCATYLMSAFTIFNVSEIFKFADKIKQKQLKTAALDYIVNHISEIMALPEWSVIEDEQKVEVLSTVVQRFNKVPKTTPDL
nr:speckle-type POZ protein B-like [Parasteatoda tepidariorum]